MGKLGEMMEITLQMRNNMKNNVHMLCFQKKPYGYMSSMVKWLFYLVLLGAPAIWDRHELKWANII